MEARLIFKPEDFDPKTELADDGQELCSYQWASRKANEKLKKLIQSWPVVRGYKSASDGLMYWHEHLMNDTHIARLAFIEEIKKEPCKHKPMAITKTLNGVTTIVGNTICQNCNIEIVAEWKPK